DDTDHETAEGLRKSVVARAQRSPSAVTKQTTGLTPDGLPVHSFRSLLADLATLARNVITWNAPIGGIASRTSPGAMLSLAQVENVPPSTRLMPRSALALVEALLLANPHHRPAVGTIRRLLQRHLVHDRRAIHQPSDRADIGPAQRRVVEDRR